MAASMRTIQGWFLKGVDEGFAYMVVFCDTYDYTDYPKYYASAEEFDKGFPTDKASSMQSVMEIYDLNQYLAHQLSERRAYHPPGSDPIEFTCADSACAIVEETDLAKEIVEAIVADVDALGNKCGIGFVIGPTTKERWTKVVREKLASE